MCAWNVRFVFCVVVYCAVSSCVGVGAGVGVQCVFASVCGAAWHAEKKPCSGSARLRVYIQNTSVHTEAF